MTDCPCPVMDFGAEEIGFHTINYPKVIGEDWDMEHALNDELDRAQMLAPEAMPHDVVTMNSKVKFRDLTSGEERVRTLVFPSQVTDSASQLSVLAPVGAALLGLKVGSTIHWELPGGASTHLEVLELLYQPEAAGEFHR